MSDILGWRGLFGILGPSTNTVVQPEFDDMRPNGITNHYSRILTPNADAVSNESFMNATLVIANNVLEAVDSVMTCSPSYLVMGMSAITFYGGSKGADDFQSLCNPDIRRDFYSPRATLPRASESRISITSSQTPMLGTRIRN